MIRIRIDSSQFKSSANKISEALNTTVGPSSVNSIARAAGSIAAKEFIKSINRTARSDKKTFHHLYEWSAVGSDKDRLFTVKKTVSGGKVNLDIVFKKSKKPVPIARQLRQPGKTGKSVVRQSIFRNKAEAMEKGRGANWTAKRNVVFLGNGSLIFKRKGTVFNISNVGGSQTTGALERFTKKWEIGMAPAAIEKSKLFNKIESSVARSMSGSNASAATVRSAIKEVCASYDLGREF